MYFKINLKISVVFLFILIFIFSSTVFAQDYEWAESFGGTTSDTGRSISVDASGNVYTTGYFENTVDFDPGAGTTNLTSSGDFDIFIQKLDASGNFVWAKSFGGTSSDQGYSISVDASGNVYTTGSFQNTADFDPGAGTANLTSSGSSDIFVQKLDSSGNLVWAKSFGGTSFDQGYSIIIDASGNVYTTGSFLNTADFDPGAGTANLNSSGSSDIFVQKLDSSGNLVWAKSFGGTSFDNGRSISIDASGNVYTTGRFQNTVDFDPGAGTANLTSSGNTDIFIQKLDSSGNLVWAKSFGGISGDLGSSINFDASGNVYTTGYFENTVDFDPGAGTTNLTSSGVRDIFVQKLDSSGNLVWAKSFGGTSSDNGRSISIDASGNVYTTGFFTNTVDFDPGAGTANLTSSGSSDIFVLKLSQTPNCEIPNNLSVTNIAYTTADLAWDAAVSETNGYDYVLVSDGSVPNASTTPTGSVSTGITSVGLTGLISNTAYDAYVRTNCGSSNLSDWSVKSSFKTLSLGGNILFEEVIGTSFDGFSSSSIAFSDVDDDGDQDVLFTGLSSGQRTTKLYINDGNANFTQDTSVPFDGVYLGSIAFSDVESDGDQDVLITGEKSFGLNIAKLYTNDGSGNFTEDTSANFSNVWYSSIAFSDVDGDADQDVLITGENSSSVNIAELYVNVGNGNFTKDTSVPFDGVYLGSIAFSDIDGDADQDVLITGLNNSSQYIAKLYKNDSNGNFTEDTSVPFDGVARGSIAFSDVNNDGDEDVLITGLNSSSQRIAKLYTNDGSGNFTEDTSVNFDGVGRSSITFSDADDDGDQDVIITGRNSSFQPIAKFYENDGSGNFTEDTSVPFDGVRSGSIAFSDDDGDSDEDVLITGTNSSGQSISKLYRNLTNNINWEGTVSSDWSNVNNWQSNKIPQSNSIVVIPDVPNQPIISNTENVILGSLTTQNNTLLTVYGDIKVTNKFINNGLVTFKSDASDTGQFDTFNGTYSGTGSITVEQFIPAGDNNRRVFRFLSSPLTTSTSIHDNWQEGATSNTDNPHLGFGTHITGSTTDGVNGFDGTISGASSLLIFDNATQTWSDITNTNVNTLESGKAYNLFVRGDRSIVLSNASQTPTNTILRATGSLTSGNVDFTSDLSTVADEFNLIGNPYQAIVDFTSLTTTDIKTAFFFVWDPNGGTAGNYVAFDGSPGEEMMIQPGQSFFVQNSVAATSPTLVFNQDDKNPSGAVTSVFNTSQLASVNLELFNANNIKLDVMKLRFEAGADNGIDDFDAGKLGNPTENLASANGNALLSIERRDLPKPGEILPLFINQYQDSQYEFRLNTLNLNDNFEIYIVDHYLNTSTLINDNQTYSFTVDASIPESTATDRFSISFENTTLGVNDSSFGDGFSLFPNPTKDGLFSIKTQNLSADDLEIRILNLMGQQVMEQNHKVKSNGEINVNASNLSSGVYMVELTQGNQNFTTKLIIQ